MKVRMDAPGFVLGAILPRFVTVRAATPNYVLRRAGCAAARDMCFGTRDSSRTDELKPSRVTQAEIQTEKCKPRRETRPEAEAQAEMQAEMKCEARRDTGYKPR